MLGTFDYQQATEGGASAKVESCFESTTGFLLRARTLTSGTTEGSHDLLSVLSRDSTGNLTSTQFFGGDTQTLGTGALCSLSLPANLYRIDTTWQYGAVRTSRYVDGSGLNLSFLNLDLDIDANTGLATTSRDTAGISTSFTYDTMGRTTWAKPQASPVDGGAWVNYVYTNVAGTTPARANVYACPNNSTSGALAQEEYSYDGLGRLLKHRSLLASGSWNQELFAYNPLGWIVSESEEQPDGTSGSAIRATTYSNFDAFGRPTTITPPDGTGHNVTVTYYGVRRIDRTAKVATSTTSESSVTTSEIYDRQGRLYQLIEPSGAAGANVTSTYAYDVGNRLKQAGTTSGTTTQNRVFTYDTRGFLTFEQLPEKGVSGNGTVSYSNYDARGHVGRIVDGPNDLTYSYDRAERLTQVRETGGYQRTLKSFTFATSNLTGDWANGKLKQAVGNNYYNLASPTTNFLAQETYT